MLQNQQQSPALEDLEAFVRVAETGSFTAAAKRMRLPKSTISRRIARLEAGLDTALVVRTSRKVGLTEAGAVYLERVAPALSKIDEASRAAREERERPRGHLRVTAPFDVAMVWLAPKIASFRSKHPEVTIEVLVDDRRLDLAAEGIDLAVRAATRLEDSSLVARKIATATLALWASPAYLKKRGTPRSPDDLARHDLIVHRASQERGVLLLHGPGGERAVQVRAAIGSNDFPFVYRLAAEGGGVAVLPSILASAEAPLARVLPDWTLGTSSLYLVHASAQLVPAKVRAFRDHLIEHAGELEKMGCPSR
jgi:DNA-binding transcriptional LysR family regulator